MTGVALAWGFSWTVSGVAGIGWMLTGPLVAGFDPATMPRFEAICYLPLTMHGAMALAAGMKREGTIATALAIGFAGLGGSFSTLIIHVYLWIAVLLIALVTPSVIPAYLRFADDPLAGIGEAPRPKRKVWRLIGTSILALTLGLAIGAANWIQEMEWNRLSNWSRGVERDVSFASALTDGLIPKTASSTLSFYFGAGAMCFAASALMGRGRRRLLARASIMIAVLAWVLAAGGFHPEAHRAIYSALPGYRWLLPLSDLSAIVALGVVVAAAAGLEEFLSPSPRPNALRKEDVTPEMLRASAFRARGSMWMTFAVAAAVWALVSRMRYLEIASDPAMAEHAAGLLGRMRLGEGLMTVLGFAGAWAFAASMPDRLKAKREVAFGLLIGLIGFIAIDLVRNATGVVASVPEVKIYAETGEKNPSISTARVRGDAGPRYELHQFGRKLIGPRIAGDIEPRALRSYSEIYDRLGPENRNFISLFNLRPLPKMLAVLEDIGTSNTQAMARNEPPYLRQSRHKTFVETREELLTRIAAPDFNALESATGLIADLPPEISADAPHRFSHRDAGLIATINKQESGETRLETKTKLEGWFEASEPMLPGWEVRIDGKPPKYPTSQSNGFFLSFHLPAGQHVLQLAYHPVSFELGLYVSLLGAACLAFIFGHIAGSKPIFESTRRRGALPSLAAREDSKDRQKVWEI